MATIPSFIEEIHGILAYQPEVLELDHPWDATGPYTFSETWPKLPEDFHCELIEGHIVMSPTAPFDVVFDDQTILQPDLIFLSPERRQLFRGVMHGAPDVCIEIISPSRPKRDRKVKYEQYEKQGVPEYWLFDPASQSAKFYQLVNDRYHSIDPVNGIYQSPRLPYLFLDLPVVWQRLDEALAD
jgi:hypothetical protein